MEKLVINRPVRVVIYIKDIIIITGRSKSAARRLYWSMMRKYEKKPGQFITFQEFSIFTGIDELVVQEHLRKN